MEQEDMSIYEDDDYLNMKQHPLETWIKFFIWWFPFKSAHKKNMEILDAKIKDGDLRLISAKRCNELLKSSTKVHQDKTIDYKEFWACKTLEDYNRFINRMEMEAEHELYRCPGKTQHGG